MVPQQATVIDCTEVEQHVVLAKTRGADETPNKTRSNKVTPTISCDFMQLWNRLVV